MKLQEIPDEIKIKEFDKTVKFLKSKRGSDNFDQPSIIVLYVHILTIT